VSRMMVKRDGGGSVAVQMSAWIWRVEEGGVTFRRLAVVVRAVDGVHDGGGVSL